MGSCVLFSMGVVTEEVQFFVVGLNKAGVEAAEGVRTGGGQENTSCC